MVKHARLLSILFLSILLLIVTKQTFAIDRTEPDRLSAGSIRVWVDPINGCEYLTKAGSDSSLTPRLNTNGTQVCRPNGRLVDSRPDCK